MCHQGRLSIHDTVGSKSGQNGNLHTRLNSIGGKCVSKRRGGWSMYACAINICQKFQFAFHITFIAINLIWLISVLSRYHFHSQSYTYWPVWTNLTHWGRVTHTCIIEIKIIGSNNGLLIGRHKAIFWTDAGILLIGPLGTNFSKMFILNS